jgi:hypothetical protein
MGIGKSESTPLVDIRSFPENTPSPPSTTPFRIQNAELDPLSFSLRLPPLPVPLAIPCVSHAYPLQRPHSSHPPTHARTHTNTHEPRAHEPLRDEAGRLRVGGRVGGRGIRQLPPTPPRFLKEQLPGPNHPIAENWVFCVIAARIGGRGRCSVMWWGRRNGWKRKLRERMTQARVQADRLAVPVNELHNACCVLQHPSLNYC